MSYDIRLLDPVTRETIELDEVHFMHGGTYTIGGTRELWLNVTYNYGSLYHRSDVLGEKGIRAIYGMTGADSIAMLEKAASETRRVAIDTARKAIQEFKNIVKKVETDFADAGGKTRIVTVFEAESENPVEMQKGGWQAILDNFKKYTEAN